MKKFIILLFFFIPLLVQAQQVLVNGTYDSAATQVQVQLASATGTFPSTNFVCHWWNSTDYATYNLDRYKEDIFVQSRGGLGGYIFISIRGYNGTTAQSHAIWGKNYSLIVLNSQTPSATNTPTQTPTLTPTNTPSPTVTGTLTPVIVQTIGPMGLSGACTYVASAGSPVTWMNPNNYTCLSITSISGAIAVFPIYKLNGSYYVSSTAVAMFKSAGSSVGEYGVVDNTASKVVGDIPGADGVQFYSWGAPTTFEACMGYGPCQDKGQMWGVQNDLDYIATNVPENTATPTFTPTPIFTCDVLATPECANIWTATPTPNCCESMLAFFENTPYPVGSPITPTPTSTPTTTPTDTVTSTPTMAVSPCTGGTVTNYGGYRIHTFTSTGNFVIPVGGPSSFNFIEVAGGGGGGAGGGGGGGVTQVTSMSISSGTYPVTVGTGGTTFFLSNPSTNGDNGGKSAFNGVTVAGGGGGGGINQAAGSDGGCGGGGGTRTATSTGGAGITGQGYAGGGNAGHTSPYYVSGGGGGANEIGFDAPSAYASGNGGDGLVISIPGRSVTFGDGGGGSDYYSSQTLGFGGHGGANGGNGGNPASDGVDGTGCGGGGSCSNGTAGVGGDGEVIIWYPY